MEVRDEPPSPLTPSRSVQFNYSSLWSVLLATTGQPSSISLSILPPLEAKETSPPRWVEECKEVEQGCQE